MLANFKTNLDDIKIKITDIGNGLLEANVLILSALTDCDTEKFTELKQMR